MTQHRVLILGGTTEARILAGKLAERGDLDITLSLAGRTIDPARQPVPVRTGGFGGAEGLAAWIGENDVALMVDATHPYAANISANAARAARMARVDLIGLRRPAWTQLPGDRWTLVSGPDEAVDKLGATPRRVFLALGRQEIAAFERAPRHSYVIRSVDPVDPPLAVPDAAYLLGRGPFREEDDRRLLEHHRIDAIVAKNSGGAATYGKVAAARRLGIEMLLLARPVLPDVASAETVEQTVAMVAHRLPPAEKRGV